PTAPPHGVSRPVLSPSRPALPLPAGGESAPGRTPKRGAGVGAARLLRRGGVGLPDAAAGRAARPGLRPQQRQPLALAVVPVGAVRLPRPRSPGASLSAVLVDARLRRVPLATEGLTATLVALSFIGPEVLTDGVFVRPQADLILAAAALQLSLGLWRDHSARCLLGTVGLAVAVMLALPEVEPPF